MFSNMKPAERRLLEHCKIGKPLDLGKSRPTEKTADNEIRGEFLRHLILSNNQEIEESGKKYILKIDPKGVQFSGVYISGIFDFSFCSTDLPFSFMNSFFESRMAFFDSQIKILNLSGSKVLSLDCFRLICQSDIILRNGFESNGEVNFVSSQIGGNLECLNGKFIKIGSGLNCKNGKFINDNGIALNCNSITAGNITFLFNAFLGNVDFGYSQIEYINFSKVDINGYLNLTSTKINTIFIAKLDEIKISNNIYLDGLTYEHLDVKKLNYKTLLSLLNKIPKEETFKPQPYKQMAKVLRNMGHHEDANNIMIKYNDIITGRSENWFIKKLKQIYGFTAGYGYKPMRVIFSMFTVWLFCSLFYWNTSKVAIFAPTNPLVFQKKDFYQCNVNSDGTSLLDTFSWSKYNSSNNWILNENIEGEYTTFNPFIYSLDVILPIVDLQVEKDWGQYVSSNNGTLNDFTRWLMWFEILFGWIYSLILVAILSGLAKNEKD